MAAYSRSASHYSKRTPGQARRHGAAHSVRDAQYRAALGIEDAGPLPRELGVTRHQRPEVNTTYLD